MFWVMGGVLAYKVKQSRLQEEEELQGQQLFKRNSKLKRKDEDKKNM